MPDAKFDPYYEWLSIPPVEQPANFYRLLAVPLFETDTNIIETAAQRQMSFVRTFALGERGEHAQSLLTELAKARATLLNPDSKAKYDSALNAKRSQQSGPSPSNAGFKVGPSVQIDIPMAPVTSRKTSRSTNHRKQSLKLVPWIAGFVGLLVAGLLFVWLRSGPKQPVVAELPVSEQPNEEVKVVEAQEGFQPSQQTSEIGSPASSPLDSPIPSVEGVAEEVVEEIAEAIEREVEPETTAPFEPEKARREMVVASRERSVSNKTPQPAIAPFDADQAKSYQEAWAEHLQLDVEITNSIGMKLRVIPPGTFIMGEEQSAHEVTLTTPFLVGVHEVTQEQYQKVMVSDSSGHKKPQNPVANVTWDDAIEFCRRLSVLPMEQQAGRFYRLPTEAEWEFACRSGTTTTYSFGDEESLLSSYGWYRENADRTTHPVGSKLANPFGLYDMHGNVSEWCNDWYKIYPGVSVTDPTGPTSGSSRVLRGGSMSSREAKHCRSAHRNQNRPWGRYGNFGFRISCVLSDQINVAVATSPEAAASSEMDNGTDEPDVAVSPPIPEPASNGPAPAVAPFDAADAKALQGRWARHLGERVEVTNSIGMKLRVIPPGTFKMGEENETHKVTLTTAFLLGVYEVTQLEYLQIMGGNPSAFKGPQNPVEMVTWDDANEFCRRLSLLPKEKRAERVYRLPTEAEWAFACRAGTTTTYSFGNDASLLSRYGWYKEGGRTTHPVGSKLANPFGLYDMHGNVWEWCQDWYGVYASDDVTNPTGPLSGSTRVHRGGNWSNTAWFCRSAGREGHEPSVAKWPRNAAIGFRVVCVPSDQASE